jgi:hypothetical protein
MNFADYVIKNEGVVICEPCIVIGLFSDLDLRLPGAPSVLAPYQAFMDSFRDRLTYCRVRGDQMHFKRVSEEYVETLPRQLADDKRRKKGGVVAEFMSSKTQDERLSPAIDFIYSHIGQPHTAVRTCLPLSWFSEMGLAGLRKFLEVSLTEFPLQAGYVGYSLFYNNNYESLIEPHIFAWLQRHPGLLEPMFSHSIVSQHGLVDLGWITLLGKDFVDRMGGATSLKEAVSHIDGIDYLELPHNGLGIQIGDQPRMGDILKGEPLNDYRALGRVLAPLRNRQALHEGMAVAGFDDNEYPGLREKWIDRFFPE